MKNVHTILPPLKHGPETYSAGNPEQAKENLMLMMISRIAPDKVTEKGRQRLNDLGWKT